jgi:hypothetical protein
LTSFSVRFAEGSAIDGEILREHGDAAAVDLAEARNHAIAEWPRGIHPEIGGTMPDKGIEFDKGSGIEQVDYALVRAPLPALRLLFRRGIMLFRNLITEILEMGSFGLRLNVG